MKKTLAILLLTVISAFSSESEESLKLQLQQVKIGMTRAEVEKIVQRQKSSPLSAIGTGGARFETFWIDPHWKISIGYDYTGIPRDKEGKARDHVSLENKVVSTPQLIREDMPSPLVMKTKKSNKP